MPRVELFCCCAELFQLLSQLESEGGSEVPDMPWAKSDEGPDSGSSLGPASAPSSAAAETLDVVEASPDGITVATGRPELLLHYSKRGSTSVTWNAAEARTPHREWQKH